MDTQTEAGEKVSVHFTGLLAHWFENVVQDNILFGMDEISVDAFFEQNKDLLSRTISYGFPACCSIEELREPWIGSTSGYLSLILPLGCADLYWLRR